MIRKQKRERERRAERERRKKGDEMVKINGSNCPWRFNYTHDLPSVL
jgi:hypothetical protein